MHYFSVPQAAALIEMSPENVRKLIYEGKFPVESERVGQRQQHKIPASGLRQWIEGELEYREQRVNALKKSLKKVDAYLS